MLYRLFINANGDDVQILLTHLKSIGQLEVRNESDTKVRNENMETIFLGAPALKSQAFLLLLSFIYKVNRIYSLEEIAALESEVDHLIGVVLENIKLLREKLPRESSENLIGTVDFLRAIKHKVIQNIKCITANPQNNQLIHLIRVTDNKMSANTLVNEAEVDKVALNMSPPKPKALRQVFEYLVSLLGAAGTGGTGATFGVAYLASWGMPLLGIIATIAGLTLLVGGSIAYYFRQSDQERKEEFVNAHKMRVKDVCTEDMNVINLKRQFMIQEEEKKLDHYSTQYSEECKATFHKHKLEMEQLQQKSKADKESLEHKLSEALKTISSQQALLMSSGSVNKTLTDAVERIGKYIQRVNKPDNPVEASDDDEEESLEDGSSLLPQKIKEGDKPVEMPKESKSDTSLLTARQVVKDVRSLSNRLIKTGVFSAQKASPPPSGESSFETPTKNVSKRIDFVSSTPL